MDGKGYMAANAFDMNTVIVTMGNVILNVNTNQRETVKKVDKANEIVACESGKRIGFEQLKKGWRKL